MKQPETHNNLVCISVTNMEEPVWLDATANAAYRTLELLHIHNWELSINFCDDSFIRDLNARYRQKDTPTDVLSFSQDDYPGQQEPAGDKSRELPDAAVDKSQEIPGFAAGKDFFPGYIDPEGRIIAGDIVISVDTASRNAAQFGIQPEMEIRRLLIHGILHLNGMDHDEDNEDMLILQEKLLNQIQGGEI